MDNFRLEPELDGVFNVLEMSGVGGGGRNRSLITALPSVSTTSSGCMRLAINSSSFEPNTLESSDLDSTKDWEPSAELWTAMDPLRFLMVKGERDEECSSKRVLDEVSIKSSDSFPEILLSPSGLTELECEEELFFSESVAIGVDGLIPSSLM